jgi:hypothetical protein
MRISVYKNDVMGIYESNVHKVETVKMNNMA